MKGKIQLISILITILLSMTYCGNNTVKDEHKEDEHNHNEALEGMVVLTPAQRQALNLKIGQVSMRNMSALINANGILKVSPTDKAEITSFMGGNVKSIKVFQGNKVRKGQILATLEHPDLIQLQQEYIEAANNYNFSKKEFERQKKLYENKAGSGKIFQKTEADFKNFKAKYEGLQIKLKMLNMNYKEIEAGTLEKEMKIISPISGYVNQIDISLGSFVNAATKMFSISNNNNIHADLLIYEKDIPYIKIGQKARLQVANKPEVELNAQIFSIAKEYQKDAKAVLIHAHIENAPDELIAGSYVHATIFTQNTNKQSVPEDAIVTDGGKKYIFVFDANASEIANHVEADEHEHDKNEAHEDDHNHKEGDDHDHDADHNHKDGDDHDHDADHNHKDGDDHNHDEIKYEQFKDKKVAFRMVEVLTGVEDNSYVAIQLLENIDKDAEIVLDDAFYLLSDLKKSEAAHTH